MSVTLLNDEQIKKVQAAFDVHIFLSYRKKDREEANKLMSLIHSDETLRDIAIWYDEFLATGVPFDESIQKELKECDLFTLLVTPNLLEDNYILREEYPMAKRENKEIIPAECRIRINGTPVPHERYRQFAPTVRYPFYRLFIGSKFLMFFP